MSLRPVTQWHIEMPSSLPLILCSAAMSCLPTNKAMHHACYAQETAVLLSSAHVPRGMLAMVFFIAAKCVGGGWVVVCVAL